MGDFTPTGRDAAERLNQIFTPAAVTRVTVIFIL
jgi:hypothetical protein